MAGDIVTWQLDNGRPHIGIVIGKTALFSGNPLVMHNIGGGQVSEDVLFSWKITGHYRYKAGKNERAGGMPAPEIIFSPGVR